MATMVELDAGTTRRAAVHVVTGMARAREAWRVEVVAVSAGVPAGTTRASGTGFNVVAGTRAAGSVAAVLRLVVEHGTCPSVAALKVVTRKKARHREGWLRVWSVIVSRCKASKLLTQGPAESKSMSIDFWKLLRVVLLDRTGAVR